MADFPGSLFSTTNPSPGTSRATGLTGPAEQVTALNNEVTAIEAWLGINGGNVVTGILAGSGISISPPDGLGNVTITATGGGGGSGTVTNVTGVAAQGFTVSVASGTTTPAITVGTSITGILKGNGTAISAASTTGTGNVVQSASPTLTGAPLAPTAAPGTNTTQIATTAFVEAALGTTPSTYIGAAIANDPAPAIAGTYYNAVYPVAGTFTLPSASPTQWEWIILKNRGLTTITVTGTVDANTAFTVTPGQSVTFVYNGTDWDAN